jgi:ferric-dicitrate binding protein FerR (iron transport regulator)
MKKVLGAALIAALVLPSVAFAADKAGKVKTWVAGTKVVTLEDGTACTLAANVAVPATLAVGKDVTLTYTTANNVNTCSAVAVK